MTIVVQPIDVGVDIPAGVYTTVAGCPADAVSAVVNLRLISRSMAQNISIRVANVPLAFVDGATAPTADEWMQPLDLVLGPDGIKVGILEDSGIVLAPGRKLVVYSNLGFLTAHMHGFVRKVQ